MKTASSRDLYMSYTSQGVLWQLEKAKRRCSHTNPMTHLKSCFRAPVVSDWALATKRPKEMTLSAKARIYHNFAVDVQLYSSHFQLLILIVLLLARNTTETLFYSDVV